MQKTYWHLKEQRRMPSEYEIATSRLHYYRTRGFEINVPLAGWYRQYQDGSPLTCSDWEKFADPRETSYTTYTALQAEREAYVDGMLQAMTDEHYVAGLAKPWLDNLESTMPVLRFPVHGLQMVAAYVGQMAPASRITITCTLQAADEMRRIQRFAYRMALLAKSQPAFGAQAKNQWQDAPSWQPLRRLVEMLLVTYDWGEAFTALNLVVKPAFDACFGADMIAAARNGGDYLWAEILRSLDEDAIWHRNWSRALVELIVSDRPTNQKHIDEWTTKWQPLVDEAIAPFKGEGRLQHKH